MTYREDIPGANNRAGSPTSSSTEFADMLSMVASPQKGDLFINVENYGRLLLRVFDPGPVCPSCFGRDEYRLHARRGSGGTMLVHHLSSRTVTSGAGNACSKPTTADTIVRSTEHCSPTKVFESLQARLYLPKRLWSKSTHISRRMPCIRSYFVPSNCITAGNGSIVTHCLLVAAESGMIGEEG
jgi:hypothetical protein